MRSEPRWYYVVFAVGLGVVSATAAVLGGHEPWWFPGYAVALLTASGVRLSRGEFARMRRGSRDERQQRMVMEARAFAGQITILVAVIGFNVELFRGRPGPFTLICGVGGLAFLLGMRRAKAHA